MVWLKTIARSMKYSFSEEDEINIPLTLSVFRDKEYSFNKMLLTVTGLLHMIAKLLWVFSCPRSCIRD